ncbi:MAG: aminotransferase class I/II-fold pyridoxal phosphate-dependent enzyme [Planctomycetota bacterium]|nr:aminotransferase class I/II-fold pyridoxal phosphate-dependent enzyme [Planctomycetota bacterium]
MRTFRSDNNAGLCPEAMAALIEANDGVHRIGYGDDELTAAAVDAFRDLFGPDTAVFFVATGTAGNLLAAASLLEPWEEVICHHFSHFNEDESTGPERIAHCRVVTLTSADGSSRMSPDDLRRAARKSRGDVHQPQPGLVTFTNATEMGEVYTPEETRELCTTARELGYRVHLDGARFANAVAALDCDPRELANDAGVDALTFGGTKNGLANSEAVLFFPQGDGSAYRRAVHAFPYHRKATGHLLSKHRFTSAPLAATLRDGIWLRHAAHANAMAALLADGLRELGLELAAPVQANEIFAHFPDAVHAALQKAGHAYYPVSDPAKRLYRLVASFDTQPEDVAALLADAKAAMGR